MELTEEDDETRNDVDPISWCPSSSIVDSVSCVVVEMEFMRGERRDQLSRREAGVDVAASSCVDVVVVVFRLRLK